MREITDVDVLRGGLNLVLSIVTASALNTLSHQAAQTDGVAETLESTRDESAGRTTCVLDCRDQTGYSLVKTNTQQNFRGHQWTSEYWLEVQDMECGVEPHGVGELYLIGYWLNFNK